MPRTRRNPPSLKVLSIGTLAVGVAGFVAFKMLYKPRPIIDSRGIVVRGGYLPGISMSGPNKGGIIYIFYPVGAKPQ